MDISLLKTKLSCRKPGVLGIKRHYAVLVPLVEWQGETCVLLEVRADTLRRQPGEICFPGGHQEVGETLLRCATRETQEELGIDPAYIHTLGQLDAVYHQAGFLLHPFVAQVDADAVEHLTCNPDEVKDTFLVPLSFLKNTPPQRYSYTLEPNVGADFPYAAIGFPEGYDFQPGKVEVFIWNYENHAIWGLTARILHHFLEESELQ